jgi:hypothetical protein
VTDTSAISQGWPLSGPKRTLRIYDGVDAPDGIDAPKWRC